MPFLYSKQLADESEISDRAGKKCLVAIIVKIGLGKNHHQRLNTGKERTIRNTIFT